MADVLVEVKKAAPAETTGPDVWRSFRGEMDRLFYRFWFSVVATHARYGTGMASCEFFHFLGTGD